MDVVVPDLGDFSDVEVVEVLVSAGDTVALEDPLIVLETDKASMELPSPQAGTIREMTVKAGDRVSAGDVIAIVQPAEGDQEKADSPAPDASETGPTAPEAGSGDSTRSAAGVEAQPRQLPVLVPDLGDFTDVEIVDVVVGPGDTVQRDDPLIVLETDKATMEVPAPHGGEVVEIQVRRGDRVSAGDAILTLLTREADAPQSTAPTAAATQAAMPEPKSDARPVGRPVRPQPRAAAGVNERSFGLAHASPSVRKLARELGVDLGSVTGSGRKGRVTADDLKAHVKAIMLGGGPASMRGLPSVPEVDFASFGEIERKPLNRIQKISGPRLHASWVNIPHVTQHDEADITELEAARQALKSRAKRENIHLTPLAFVMLATLRALEEFPVFRSSLDPDGETLIIKKYFHLGFAADTPNGLVVPVVKNADRLSLFELAGALGELSEKARAGKLGASEIQGAVFTISSLGGIGGTFFTPIINAPEVAILGVSRNQQRPVYRDGALVPRLILPLSLSYDHRVIDGATAVRFTTRLAALLAQGEALIGSAS